MEAIIIITDNFMEAILEESQVRSHKRNKIYKILIFDMALCFVLHLIQTKQYFHY